MMTISKQELDSWYEEINHAADHLDTARDEILPAYHSGDSTDDRAAVMRLIILANTTESYARDIADALRTIIDGGLKDKPGASYIVNDGGTDSDYSSFGRALEALGDCPGAMLRVETEE